jgi:Epoxide hydrolase N terminus
MNGSELRPRDLPRDTCVAARFPIAFPLVFFDHFHRVFIVPEPQKTRCSRFAVGCPLLECRHTAADICHRLRASKFRNSVYRINATKWPERETVADQSQGVQLTTIQALARYWATEYDWRKVEAKLNALPQYITEIDGLDIHFINVRSKHANALPLMLRTDGPARSLNR